MRLLADCGNTAVKLGLADGSRVREHDRLPADPAALGRFLDPRDHLVDELVVLPGGRRTADLVRAWWATAGRGRPQRLVGGDLPLPDLGQYPGCGPDRVAAGLAATVVERTSVICVDAGTATTFAAWRFDPTAGDPLAAVRFLGGLILPGAQACLDGLAAAAPALPRVLPGAPGMPALQRDTAGALAAALGIGYGPMVAACLVKLERETGIRQVAATGGNIALLIDSKVVAPGQVHPDLVLRGLALIAGI